MFTFLEQYQNTIEDNFRLIQFTIAIDTWSFNRFKSLRIGQYFWNSLNKDIMPVKHESGFSELFYVEDSSAPDLFLKIFNECKSILEKRLKVEYSLIIEMDKNDISQFIEM